jgi:hypothetical protein
VATISTSPLVSASHRRAVVRMLRHFDLRIFSQHGNCDRAAEIGVEGIAIAVIVGGRVLGLFHVDAAAQHARRTHARQRCFVRWSGFGGICNGASDKRKRINKLTVELRTMASTRPPWECLASYQAAD